MVEHVARGQLLYSLGQAVVIRDGHIKTPYPGMAKLTRNSIHRSRFYSVSKTTVGLLNKHMSGPFK